MKIRQGFISNSSSSSFLLMGMLLDKDDKRIGESEWGEPELGKLNFAYGIEKYHGGIVFGIGPDLMKDDETLLEFKQKVVDMFIEAGIECITDNISLCMDVGHY